MLRTTKTPRLKAIFTRLATAGARPRTPEACQRHAKGMPCTAFRLRFSNGNRPFGRSVKSAETWETTRF